MDDNLHKGARPSLFHFARLNRKSQTEAERVLWEALRDRRLFGFKFRRQHPVGDFIADFFCLERNLAIEVDGGYHFEKDQREYDNGRTPELRDFGVTILRFTNDEVICDTDSVIRVIADFLLKTPSDHP
jgi:very-short-patch-repair endonuclease